MTLMLLVAFALSALTLDGGGGGGGGVEAPLLAPTLAQAEGGREQRQWHEKSNCADERDEPRLATHIGAQHEHVRHRLGCCFYCWW